MNVSEINEEIERIQNKIMQYMKIGSNLRHRLYQIDLTIQKMEEKIKEILDKRW